jgi:N-acetylneuraminate synthase
MFGVSNKIDMSHEQSTRLLARRSIVANKDIKLGDIFTIDNITFKRPGTGVSPKEYSKFLGKCSKRSIKEDEMIFMEDIA